MCVEGEGCHFTTRQWGGDGKRNETHQKLCSERAALYVDVESSAGPTCGGVIVAIMSCVVN